MFVAMIVIGIGQFFTVQTWYETRWEGQDDHVYSAMRDYEECRLIGGSFLVSGFCIAPPGVERRRATKRYVTLDLEMPSSRAWLTLFAMPVCAICGAILFGARLMHVIRKLRRGGVPTSNNVLLPTLALLAPLGATSSILILFASACEVFSVFAYDLRQPLWTFGSIATLFAWAVWIVGGAGVVIAVFRNCAPPKRAWRAWLVFSGVTVWVFGTVGAWFSLGMVWAALY